MKYLSLILITVTGLLHASTVIVQTAPHNGDKELSWVDEQIQAILPARIGVADGYITSLKDPVRMKSNPISLPTRSGGLLPPPTLNKLTGLVEVPKVVEEPLRLSALMNRSALINGKWYKVGESIRSFSVAEIKNNSVLLTGKKDQKLLLFLSKQNNNIKITTK